MKAHLLAQTIFTCMKASTLFFLCLCCIAGCAPHFKYSKCYDRSTVAEIEHKYQRLFEVENKIKPAFVDMVLDNAKYIRQGSPDYQPPGLIYIYLDLRQMINRSLAGEKDEILMRRYLMRKIGVVSSLVAFPRSEDVEAFLSPRDRHAFTPEEIRAICGRHPPKYSALAKIILDNEKLCGPQ